MKAIDLAFVILFVNCGFAIVSSIGVFGSDIDDLTGSTGGDNWGYGALSILSEPIFSIEHEGVVLFSVTGIMGLAGLIAASTIVVFNSNLVNERGVAIAAFTILFYGGVFLTGVTIFSKFDFPGLNLFYMIFVLFCTLSYVLTIIQMPTQGQGNFG